MLGVERSSSGIPIALLGRPGMEAYAGDAMIVLPDHRRQEFWAAVGRLGTPGARLASLANRRQATWVREGVVARVRHLRGADKLRHATLHGLEVRDSPATEGLSDRVLKGALASPEMLAIKAA